jgi:CHAD domain-containing protein
VAFRLKHGESVSRGIRRLARKALLGAIDCLQPGRAAARDDAVYEGRKNIKKTRALLELLRNHLGHTYRKDKQQLRQAARPLSQERDAKIFLDTFDDVHRRHRTALRQTRWRLVRRILEKSSADITRRASRRASITRTLNGLAAVYRDSRSWSLEARGFRALRSGLKRSIRRARNAWQCAQKDQTPANFHRWRKRVKTHWYQARLVEPIDPRRLRRYLSKLHRLETWLGDHHNLTC